jgi:acyl-CoA synthetase (AMP-forming)/AMP-acid ligase II
MTGTWSRFEGDFRALVRSHPHSLAIIDAASGREWSYLQLDALLLQCGKWLAAQGLKRQGVLVTVLPNCIESLVLFLSCLRFGVSYAPLPLDATSRDIDNIKSLLRPDLLVRLPDNKVVQESAAGSGQAGIVSDGEFGWLHSTPAAPAPMPAHEGGGKVYLMTSGTTGAPKMMVIDGDTLWQSGKKFLEFHPYVTREDRFFSTMPMSYLGGLYNLCLIPLSVGASIVIAESLAGVGLMKFWKEAARHKVTIAWLVPTVARALISLASGRKPVPNLRAGIKFAFFGTAPATATLKADFEALFGVRLLENYALSETTFITSERLGTNWPPVRPGVGEVLPYVEIFMRAEKDSEGSNIAEVGVKTPFLFEGYIDGFGNLAPPELEGGYFLTGDIGHIQDGVLHISGRVKDIIKKAGVLIVLPEIETILSEHHNIAEVAAIRIAHDYYGEDYVVLCRLKNASANTPSSELLDYLCDRVIRSKWPHELLVVEQFPYTKSGKVRKGELAAEYAKNRAEKP